MAKKGPRRKKESGGSLPTPPLQPKKRNWAPLLSNVFWAIVGVVLGVIGNELYRPHLENKEVRVPFKLIDDKVVNGERVMLHEAAINIRNEGLKKGYLDRTVVRPFGVEPFPNAEVSYVDRRDIGAKRTELRTIQIRTRRPQSDLQPVSGFLIEVFDDTGMFAFDLRALIGATDSAISRAAEEERQRRLEIQRAQQQPK